MSKAKQVALKITSAIVLDGDIVRPDAVVTVSDRQARNLLQRGKAMLAVEGDDAAEADAKAKADADAAAAAAAAEADAKAKAPAKGKA